MMMLAIVLWLTGCGTAKPNPDSWRLPKMSSPNSGMIIGRLDFSDNLKDNPKNLSLNLESVAFWDVAQAVHFGNGGEEYYIMANNYFVVLISKPGTYRFNSFRAGQVYHGLEREKGFTYEIKPGQIKYIGSYDYIQIDQSFMQKLGNRLPYDLKKVDKPTELEMLQWLYKTSAGSGWEPTIKKRIVELGGRAIP
jgi:hypothetical protein